MTELREALRQAVPTDLPLPDIEQLQQRAAHRRSRIHRLRFAAVVSVAALLVVGAVAVLDGQHGTPAAIDSMSERISRTSPEGVAMSIATDPTSPVVDSITGRLNDSRQIQEQNGEPTVPDECYPVDAITVSAPTETFDGSTYAVTSKAVNAPIAVLTTLQTGVVGAAQRELAVVAHVAQATPAHLALTRDGETVDSTTASNGWAILFAPIPDDFQGLAEQFVALDLNVESGSATAPIHQQEAAGQFC